MQLVESISHGAPVDPIGDLHVLLSTFLFESWQPSARWIAAITKDNRCQTQSFKAGESRVVQAPDKTLDSWQSKLAPNGVGVDVDCQVVPTNRQNKEDFGRA